MSLQNSISKSQKTIISIDLNKDFDIQLLIESISFENWCSKLVEKIKNSKYNRNEDKCKLVSHNEIFDMFSKKLSDFLNQLKDFNSLRYDCFNNLEANFDSFYEKLSLNMIFLNEIKNLSPIFPNVNFFIYEKSLIESIKEKLENLNKKIYENFVKMLNEMKFNESLFYDFNTALYNLRSFDKKFNKKAADLKDLKVESFENIKSKLFKNLIEKMKQLSENIETKELKEAATIFSNLKKIGNTLLLFKTEIDEVLNKLLEKYIKKNGSDCIGRLALALKSEPIGNVLVAEHKCFEFYNRSLFNQKTLSQNIENVVNQIEGNSIDKEKLKKEFNNYNSIYKNLIDNYLRPNVDYRSFISNLKTVVNKVKPNVENHNKIDWDNYIKDELPNIIAYLFALWTLLNSENYFNYKEKNSLFLPHPAQVIAIFRMLGIGYNDGFFTKVKKFVGKNVTKRIFEVTGLRNNLIEIGTGEGKSITLGITAATLALLGFDVNCVCYSKYLSLRDYTAFKPLFDKLNLTRHIHYGTFDSICEENINQNGNVRDFVKNILLDIPNNTVEQSSENKRPSVLLIDEVDVFFSKEFYGNSYQPVLRLKDETITKLIELIWNYRANINFEYVSSSQEFLNCEKKFSKWTSLIKKCISSIVFCFQNYSNSNSEYKIIDDKIGYKKQDGYTFNSYHDYYTLYSYFLEHENGKISKESLDAQIGFNISVGSFSFAEMPKDNFYAILGVTGTLRTLNETQKNLMEKEYEIKYQTYMPSVYERKKVNFNEKNDFLVYNDENYFNSIVREIETRIKGNIVGTKRAVFVVFENNNDLIKFNNSTEFAHLKLNSSILSEEVNSNEKQEIINSATFSGKITLFTKIFGRGTDFVVFDETVSVNGGVHVIQTFLSEELSEEIQIKGRTARQGEEGSYSLIVKRSSLVKFNISDLDLEENSSDLYSFLNIKRNKYFENEYAKNTKNITSLRNIHYRSFEMIYNILNNNPSENKDVILEALN